MKIYRGKVYVGVTITNESSYPTPTPVYTNNTPATLNSKGVNTAANPMRGIVYEFNGTAFSTVLNFPLSDKKQPSDADISDASNSARGQFWRPWTVIFRIDRTD